MQIINIPLAEIIEDENQPRTSSNAGFSQESLSELAASIRQVGVKSPISVREVYDKPPYKYIINFGARRFRASKLAGKETIPAYVDNEHGTISQLLENIQRKDLTSYELSCIYLKLHNEGLTNMEIAQKLSLSYNSIDKLSTICRMPNFMKNAYELGLIPTDSLTLLADLVDMHEEYGDPFQDWFRGILKNGIIDRTVISAGQRYLKNASSDDVQLSLPASSRRKRKSKTSIAIEQEKQERATAPSNPTAEPIENITSNSINGHSRILNFNELVLNKNTGAVGKIVALQVETEGVREMWNLNDLMED